MSHLNILGISAFYHDSAAALLQDGQIIAAAQEERFTRKKHDPGFPAQAIRYCLEESGLSIDQVDAVVFYDKPMLKFERLLETYYAVAPRGLRSFIAAMPVWIKEKLFLKRMLRKVLQAVENHDPKNLRLLFPEHHLSHGASAFYTSPFERAAILTIDGVGEWATAAILLGEGKKITCLKELHFPHSVGLLYSAFTYYLGFKVNSGEYKLMGLAPYGNPDDVQVAEFVTQIKAELVDIASDGSIRLNQAYFRYMSGLRMANDRKWEALFGFPRREAEGPFESHHANLAMAIQEVTEEIVLRMAQETKRLTDADYLCLAGGVALNCVSNGKLQEAGLFKEIYIQPAAGDAGGALGAALAAHHLFFEKVRNPAKPDTMQGAYLGPEFSDQAILRAIKQVNGVYHHLSELEELCETIAKELDAGKAVGWFQGRMEFGPRALGNRSILGDARNPEMQEKLNVKIKQRESFRPFAPSVLAESYQDYFQMEQPSPYMLLVHPVQENRRKALPENYGTLPLREKLYTLRSDIPAVTHIDFSARIQTVHADTNPRYHQLLTAFEALTGYGLLVNTSFNVRGEPIVCTPQDAVSCFFRTDMDVLVMGNYVLHKSEQTDVPAQKIEREIFPLD